MYFRGIIDTQAEMMIFKRQVTECAEAIVEINKLSGYLVELIKIATPTDARAVLLVDVGSTYGINLDDVLAIRDAAKTISSRFEKVVIWNDGRLVIG
jgi:hypothetical protein